MSLNVVNNSKFQERCDFNGKKENVLVIDCNNCVEKTKNFCINKKCMACFFKSIYSHKHKSIKHVLFASYEYEIDFSRVDLFVEYFSKKKKIKKLNNKLETIRKKDCIYDEFGCKFFKKDSSLEDSDYNDPLLLYSSLTKELALVEADNLLDLNCKECLKRVKEILERMLKLLNNLQIISDFKNLNAMNNFLLKPLKFYEFLFTKSYVLHEKEEDDVESLRLKEKKELIDVYDVGKDQIFQISIYNVREEYEKKYAAVLFFESNSDKALYGRIIQDSIKNMTQIKFNQVISLERLINIYKKEVITFLNSKFNELSNKEKRKIALIVALKRVKIDKLFPLLIDDSVEEIFLDSKNDEIYINHQKYGRCKTDLILHSEEIERLKTFLRIYSGQRLDYTNPSVKYVIKNKYFYCRFAIDIEPLHINKFGLDIRKLNKNIFTIQDLLKNKTLNPQMAAFLFFALIHKLNITATGETDTGKTTLINALDLLTPKEFRKIYIENAVESLNQAEFGKHQLKYVVDSFENHQAKIDGINQYSKANQIKTLLHRSPDIIYLGEILTKEEAEALFHCLAAGLRGFQTVHSKTISSLLNRVVNFFNIDPSSLNDLDLIVLMKKSYFKRRMFSISEINPENVSISKKPQIIFNFNPENQKWKLMKSLYNTNIVQKIRMFEDLNEEKFNSIMEIYVDIFQHLLDAPRIDNHGIVIFFHKISYFSFKSIDKLKQFWKRWKNE